MSQLLGKCYSVPVSILVFVVYVLWDCCLEFASVLRSSKRRNTCVEHSLSAASASSSAPVAASAPTKEASLSSSSSSIRLHQADVSIDKVVVLSPSSKTTKIVKEEPRRKRTRKMVVYYVVQIKGRETRICGGSNLCEWQALYRYNDFRQFFQQLKHAAPQHHIVAQLETLLPTKSLWRRFDRDFVENRRKRFENLIRKVVSDEELCDIPLVQTFFRCL